MKIIALALVAVCINSCTFNTEFTPTKGPLAKAGVTSIPASFTWSGSGSGKVEVTMPDGEVCTGRYSTIAGGTRSFSSGSSFGNYTGYSGLSPYSTNVYGSSTFSGTSSSMRNEQFGRGIVTGSKGRVIKFEYVTSMNNPTHGHGQGSDNRGNFYTIVF